MFRVTAAVNDGGGAVFIDGGDGPVFYGVCAGWMRRSSTVSCFNVVSDE